MRLNRELMAVLEAQPSMEHVQAALEDFSAAELDKVLEWAADRMPRLAAQYYGGMADAEQDRRRRNAEMLKSETLKSEPEETPEA